MTRKSYFVKDFAMYCVSISVFKHENSSHLDPRDTSKISYLY